MNNIEQIEQNYNFTSQDRQNLMALLPLMDQNKEKIVEHFCRSLMRCDDSDKALNDPESINIQIKPLTIWFISMFNGTYDNRYLQNIQKIGFIHAAKDLEPHYMNSSISLIRNLVYDIIESNYKNHEECFELTKSFNKILDINLEIMSSSYRQEKLKNLFFSYRLENSLIRLAERFSYGLNLFLVIALIGLSFGIMGFLSMDIWHLIKGQTQHGIINVLGTLLMLWVMIELMNTEIKHLKKGKFSITIFVEVALVAFIRDALVSSLEHGEILKQAFLVSTVLVLGVVYWLISKAEEKK